MACKGTCKQYNVSEINGGRYKDGQKRCRSCEIYLKCNDLLCPCCGLRLRVGPRTKASKERLKNDRVNEYLRKVYLDLHKNAGAAL